MNSSITYTYRDKERETYDGGGRGRRMNGEERECKIEKEE